MRFNLSLAIVAMVKRNQTTPHPSNHSYLYENENENNNFSGACLPPNPHNHSYVYDDNFWKHKTDGEFEWNEVQQGVILGAFFWGYVVTQLPGGILAQKFGGKWPLGLGILITAVFALLTPIAARTHFGLLIFVRVVQGLGEVS